MAQMESNGTAGETEDYMNDCFLAQAEEDTKKGKKRGRTTPKRNKAKNTKAWNARDRLKQGLETNIITSSKQPSGSKSTASSVALKLMKKMGYEEGKGLGPEAAGIVEPVKLHLTRDKRSGLGLEESIVRNQLAKKQKTKEFMENQEQRFREYTLNKFEDKRLRSQLKKAFSIAVQLDEDANKDAETSSFLEERDKEEKRKEDEGEHYTPTVDVLSISNVQSRLEKALTHLRGTHFYCVYCGCRYNDSEDMDQNCPGIYESDH